MQRLEVIIFFKYISIYIHRGTILIFIILYIISINDFLLLKFTKEQLLSYFFAELNQK